MPQSIKKIMVIDDNEIDLFIVKSILTTSGTNADIVLHQSAHVALNELYAVKDESQIPGLILLDIRMPVMDGFAFMEKYEKAPELVKAFAKVYMLTSSLDPTDRDRIQNHPHICGMLTKPFTWEMCNKLFTRINSSVA